MSMLPNVMILIGSTEVNKQDVVLVKAVYFISGKNQPLNKVLILLKTLLPKTRAYKHCKIERNDFSKKKEKKTLKI